MSTTLGSLVLMLRADSATFASDLGKGAAMAEASANRMAKSLSKVNEAFGMLAGGFGLQQLLSYSNSVITATAHLGELSAATGLTVPVLSSLSVTAKGAGLSIDEVAGSFDKLQKQAAAGAIGSRAQAAAFEKIGLSSTQLAAGLKDPQSLLLAVAQGMEKFADDGNKTALMMTIFGKGGAQMNSVMHELVVTGYANASATAEQAAQAERYEKIMAQTSASIQSFTRDGLMVMIPTINLVGTSIITTFSDAWIHVKYGFEVTGAWIQEKFQSWSQSIVNLGAKLGAMMGLSVDTTLKKPATSNVAGLQSEMAAQLAQNERIRQEAAKAYVDATSPAVVASKAKLPSVGGIPAIQKLGGSGNDGLIKALDDRLKIIASAMKAEDAAAKLANTQLEADYAHGLLSIANYSTQKNAILENSFKLTQSLYDAEIGLAGTYVKQIAAELAKDKAQKVDPTDAAKKTAQIARVQAELDQATAKLVVLQDEKAIAGTKHIEDQVVATNELITKQSALAKTVIDVEIAYALMNGNTELATRLQQQQRDGLTALTLQTGNFTEAYQKLLATQADEQLRSSLKGLDGMKRAVIDYQKSIADVATQTATMTTNMLKSMEDALVNFVMTGKLDFKSLITSMIADIVRLQIQQNVMGGLSKWLNLAVGSMGGGASTAVTFTGDSSALFDYGAIAGGAMAAGGAVSAGTAYTVGERGAERFVPNVAGTIVPTGSGGSAGIVYSPVIQIDSRSDRAQVQADVAQVVREGNRNLIELLRRYNPSLRT